MATICRPQSKRARVLVVPPSRAMAHFQEAVEFGCIFLTFSAFSLPLDPDESILGCAVTRWSAW